MREGGQIIVPVVIARQREEEAVAPLENSGLSLVCVCERRAELGLVVLLGCGRIDLVAAEYEHSALVQRSGRRFALRTLRWAQFRSCEQASNRVGGPPAIARVDTEIEPKIAVGSKVRGCRKIEIGVEIGPVERIERGDSSSRRSNIFPKTVASATSMPTATSRTGSYQPVIF